MPERRLAVLCRPVCLLRALQRSRNGQGETCETPPIVFPHMGGCAPSPSKPAWSQHTLEDEPAGETPSPSASGGLKFTQFIFFVLLRWERLFITHIFIDLCAFLHKAMLKTGTKSVISFTLVLSFLSPLNQTGAQTKAIPTSTHPPTQKMPWPNWVGHSLYYNKIFCCIFPLPPMQSRAWLLPF